MKKIHYAVLYTSFLLFANALSANETKFAKLNNQKFGDMKKMTIANNTTSAPKTIFFDTGGKELTLNDFKGRLTLVNFWATWCAPCRKEMPSLEVLSNQIGGDTFQVVTIATMRSSEEAVKKFFNDNNIIDLPKFRDPKGYLARASGVAALPLTILLDRNGNEISRLIGDADWAQDETIEFIKKAIEIDRLN
ncbi:TlpA family protein disulfide reductase [Paracoccaceae bacterium]|jgi:thiol-disulfide isomerase/thioredoxin|nr:TlpA family protein disulfide reductase [Paracoccaceae bacterium]|tara:strand:- start:166 stop:741 length:576 start_codon:yes stop_codon:yes gene_type:complete